MRIVRWPVVSLALFTLLIGFFLVGYISSPYLRHNLESFATETFATPVMVDNLDINVYQSHVGIENFKIIDPDNRSKYIFTAHSIKFQADISSVFKKYLLLNYIDAKNLSLKLSQKQNGRFNLIDNYADNPHQENLLVKAQEIISWTSDKIDPIDILANLDGKSNPQPPYKIEINSDQPDFIIKDLAIIDSSIELTPFNSTKAINFHAINAQVKNLSSSPKKHAKNIDFKLNCLVGLGTQAWLHSYGNLALNTSKINLNITVKATNINLNTLMPLSKVYAKTLNQLEIVSGKISLDGSIKIVNGQIVPSSVFLHFQDLTATASGDNLNIEALKNMSFNNADIELTVPIDNTPPYFHIEDAINQGDFRIQKVKNIQLRLNKDDLINNFLK